jgi:DnaJ-class molecular chaperone
MKLIVIRGHLHDHVMPPWCRHCAGAGEIMGRICQVCNGTRRRKNHAEDLRGVKADVRTNVAETED